ncbi:MAG: glycosyltransferase family 39 protein [Pyrinomonadaceae bacterium]
MNAENTKYKSHTAERVTWLLFAIVILGVYFFALDIPLLGPDEPRYSQVAREMFARGDWVTPTLGGFNWFEKPALLYWLQISSFNVFGVSEFAARFGSAVFGLGTIACLWLLGRFLRPRTDFANWLVLVGASTIGIIVFSRGASFDIILTFPLTAAMVSYFIFEIASKRVETIRYIPLVLFYFFIGVSLLAKGLVGILFPFAALAFYHILIWKRPRKDLFFSLIWGLPIAFIVAATWYIPMYQRHGWEFIDQFFVQHHFQRYTSNKYLHPQAFYFFFWVLPLMSIPWLPFFFAGVFKFGKELIRRAGAEVTQPSLTRFAIAWLLVPLVFFSLSGSKLPGYILPAVPAAALLAAECLWAWIQNDEKRKFGVKLIAFSTFAVVAILLQFAVPKFADSDSVKRLIDVSDSTSSRREKVLMFETISHNAEFYAAGRLDRSEDGKLEKLTTPEDVLEELMREGGGTMLVLIPVEQITKLTRPRIVNADLLADNGELAIVRVTLR